MEHALSPFACLSVDDVITITHAGENFKFQILECKPQLSIGIIDTDLAIDFAQPKDYDPKAEETKKKVVKDENTGKEAKESQETNKVVKVKFPGTGVQISGKRKRPNYIEEALQEKEEQPFDPRAHKIVYTKAPAEEKTEEDFEVFKGAGLTIHERKKFKADANIQIN